VIFPALKPVPCQTLAFSGEKDDDMIMVMVPSVVLPIDYVACCTPVLVGRVIGSVRVRAEVSMKTSYIEHVILTRRLFTVTYRLGQVTKSQ